MSNYKSKVVVKIGDFLLPFAHFHSILSLLLSANKTRMDGGKVGERGTGQEIKIKRTLYTVHKNELKDSMPPKTPAFDGKRKTKFVAYQTHKANGLFMYRSEMVRSFYFMFCNARFVSVSFVSCRLLFCPPTIFFFNSFHSTLPEFSYLRAIRALRNVCVCVYFWVFPFHFILYIFYSAFHHHYY